MDRPYIRFNFDSLNSGRPLSTEQVVGIIRTQILSDNHINGCRLPPVRALAHQLGISKNTVQAAYDELKSQGLIESKERSGLFVAGKDGPLSIEHSTDVPGPELKKISFLKYITPKQKEKISLSSVFVDPRLLPKEKLAACFKSVLKSPGIPEFHDPQGMPALREKIAERLKNRGMDVDMNHIIITNGSQQALDLVARALVSKVVATEDPSYYLGKNLFEMNGTRTIGLPINPFVGIDREKWEDLISQNRPGLLYLTTNFQNPNGYSYTSSEISCIVSWARQYNFGILEDDWGSEMLSYSEFKPGLRAIGGKNVLYMNSFTKKLLPSLRLGYLVANEQTIEPLLMSKLVSTIAVPSLIEAAIFEFVDRGYYDTHLKFIQKELDIRYENCLSLLREYMPEEVKWTSPGGGPILWIELPKRVSLELLCQRLKNKNIEIQLPHNAFFGKPHLHGFKIGYAFLSQKEMSDAIEKTAREIRTILDSSI